MTEREVSSMGVQTNVRNCPCGGTLLHRSSPDGAWDTCDSCGLATQKVPPSQDFLDDLARLRAPEVND